MDYRPLLKRQPKVNVRTKGSLPFRSPQKHLHAIPEDIVYASPRPSIESSHTPTRPRDITPSSTIAIKRGSLSSLSTLGISLESSSGDDYLCRTPPRPAPSPPTTPLSPLTPMAFSNASPTSPVASTLFTPSSSPPSPTSSDSSTSSFPVTPKATPVRLPNILPLNIRKRSPSPLPDLEDDGVTFYTEDLSSFIRIHSPSPTLSSSSASSIQWTWCARIQQYPFQKKTRRSAVVIPSYDPPPPPLLPVTPTTPVSLPGRSPVISVDRLPPRASLPTDLDEFELVWIEDESSEEEESEDGEFPAPEMGADDTTGSPHMVPEDVLEYVDDEDIVPVLPQPLVPQPTGEFAARFWKEVQEVVVHDDDIESPLPESPLSCYSSDSHDDNANVNALTAIAPFLTYEPPVEPGLKSKFSVSTLGSVAPAPPSKSKWKGGKLRLYLKRGSFTGPAKSSNAATTTPRTSFFPNAPESPSYWVTSPPAFPKTPRKHYYYRASGHTRARSDSLSGSEVSSIDGGLVFGEDGLKRKPIPVEMFLRS
ncbi:hypothetical protein DL96DRAFT_1643440 [Flagelloscypha sp. PMI_526]|nr:hypothetical protein DL96DRAFT_1643440 [Flagelloscypha sp. PMI_526]